MHKFFVPEENIIDGMAYISDEDVKHIYKVLRLKKNDEVAINDCCGREFYGIIYKIDRDRVQIKVMKELDLNSESDIEIHLFQGFPKSNKMDLIVQKTTELGVRKIIPIFTERVIVKNKNGELKKIERWNKIAKEACKQCGRSIIPEVGLPLDFKQIIEKLESMDLVVVPYENEKKLGIKNMVSKINKDNIKNIAVVVGAEGGFSESEIDILKKVPSNIVTLGPRVLRTETAGFVCISLLMYELGDLGGLN
ncbi:16S rRNA (uracil(1498)-N(3))-methyltransferase [Clostridium sp. LBM24168]